MEKTDENLGRILDILKKINDKVNGKKIWYNSDLITENEFYCTNCLDDRKMKVINVKLRENINRNVYDTFEEGFQRNLPLVYE